LFSLALSENTSLSEPVKPAPTLRRDRSPAARNAARRRKANRERRVVSFLNRGASIAKIAAREGVTERGMRKYVRGLLTGRAPQPPTEFLALQVSRLNEALIVAYSAMSGANLHAVDRVVTIVRELDRYHGFAFADERATRTPSRLAPPSLAPLALEAPRAETEPNGAAND
jgi:DNA-binding CsgD family transcriptional regulator